MRSFLILAAAAVSLSACSTARDILAETPDNVGPCPSALSLYDAHRVVRFVDDQEVYESVGFTGEILNVRSLCSYYDDRPIIANLEIDMGFGRGPAAIGETANYEYFVAVTRRDRAVIHTEVFPITVRFRGDSDRVFLTETIEAISIPRAEATTSGSNFEILVGFELTEEELAYNRAGKRFRVAAGQESE